MFVKKKYIIAIVICFFINTLNAQSINVLSMGAKGNNIQDDTRIIQKALDLIEKQGGGTVYIPTTKGSYKISETLYIGSNTKVVFGESFLKLVSYTKIGTILYNKKGATNIEIVNPKIDGNNISSGGTGENGISFGNGGTCLVTGGVIKNCKSGTIAKKLGGKGIQVEDRNVILFNVNGTRIINCTFALSSQYDIEANNKMGSKMNIIYSNIIAEECDTFLLLQQANGLKESSTGHNVTVSNFKVINSGKNGNVFVFSRARSGKIINGVIEGTIPTHSVFRGRHSEMLIKDVIIQQPCNNIIDLRPSFHGIATSKSEQNIYDLSLKANFDFLLYSSNNYDYSFRELFNSKITIRSSKPYNKRILLPQAIYKSSNLSFIYLNSRQEIMNKVEGGLFDLINLK